MSTRPCQRLWRKRLTRATPPPTEQEWIDTYNRVKAEGKIPGFAPSVLGADGNPSYPSGTDTGENGVCSWTSKCHHVRPKYFLLALTGPFSTWTVQLHTASGTTTSLMRLTACMLSHLMTG